MPANEIHMYDSNTSFRIQVLQDDGTIYPLEGANLLQFIFQKPDGTFITRDGHFLTDGNDGTVEYITDDTDLDQIGFWKYELYIERGGVKKHSDIGRFRVYPNLPLE